MDLEKLNRELESKSPQEIIRWAIENFKPGLAMTSSFGPESGTLLLMVSRLNPRIPVLFLDTGYHFPETLAYKKTLTRLFGLKKVITLRASRKRKAELKAACGTCPYEREPDLCCQINKVEPLAKALVKYAAWMSGIRRHQTDFRKSIQVVEKDRRGLYKISPLVKWTSRDAWWYMKEHHIPQHPLYEKGYLSIGCQPCTRPIQVGDDERSGRWAGKTKQECGIHTFLGKAGGKPAQKDLPKHLGGGV